MCKQKYYLISKKLNSFEIERENVFDREIESEWEFGNCDVCNGNDDE